MSMTTALILIALLASAVGAGETLLPVAVSPTDAPIRLFNGKDLAGFHTWLADTGRDDPRGSSPSAAG